ncbi:MAG: N-acetyltransferase [Bacteroidota bacterium]
MQLTIRPESPADYPAISQLVASAFEQVDISDHTEHLMIERLRQSAAYIPELAMVAEREGELLGFILLTKIKIRKEEEVFPSLALAPVAVLPAHQGQGIGGQLIRKAHEKARELAHHSIVLLGHADYYPRFGYQQAHTFGIRLPFEVPKENCMLFPLQEGVMEGVSGLVEYPKAFFE